MSGNQFTVRNQSSKAISIVCVIQNAGSADLPAELYVRYKKDMSAQFTIRKSSSASISGVMVVNN
jgi:hypothetical protein